MNIVGKYVTHIKYGEGKVTSIEGNKMEVEFASERKTFLYPDAFETFFVIEDKAAHDYIHVRLEEIHQKKKLESAQKEKEEQHRSQIRKMKIKVNAQAVFALNENDVKRVLDTWSISTGKCISGITKGKPRIPRNLSMNSACLLTMKPEGCAESERTILGICMVAEDFIGVNCEDGIIPTHEQYRILWKPEYGELLFWEYFPSDSRLEKWGSSEMKYLPNTLVKQILEDMVKLTLEDEKHKDILDFYHYFCSMNRL